MRSAVDSISFAAAVGLSERVVRSNRRVPNPSSSWRISMLTADWVTKSLCAAALSLRNWCTARKARSWRIVGLNVGLKFSFIRQSDI
jgi:hypothetical protein